MALERGVCRPVCCLLGMMSLGLLVICSEANAQKEEVFAREIRDLLRWGIPDEGDGDCQKAKLHFDAARKMGIDDSKAHLAYALALLDNNQISEGRKALVTASHAKAGVPSAKRLAILYALYDRKYSIAAKDLVALATLLEETPRSILPKEEKLRTARWTGRVIGFYTIRGERIRAADAIRSSQAAIEAVLSNDLEPEFAAGIIEIKTEMIGTQKPDSSDNDQLGLAAERHQHAVMEKVFKGKEFTLSEQQKLKLTQDQLDEWHRERFKIIDYNIRLLLNRLDQLTRRRDVLSSQIAAIQFSQTLTRDVNKLSNDLGDTTVQEIERARLQSEISQLSSQVPFWVFAAHQLETAAQEAGAKVAKERDSFLSLEEHFNKMKTIQEKRFQAKDNSRKAKENILNDLATYLPIDLRAERDELLKSISGGAKTK